MSDKERAVVPIDERHVDFYGDEIIAVLVEIEDQQKVFVPLKPICEFLGVDWDAQRQRIGRDPVLSEFVQGAVITTAPSTGGRGGGPQEMLCLQLDYLNGWLFGINANRVKESIRERLIRYQKECYQILATAFVDMPATTESPSIQALTQIREMGRAIMQMAEQQIELERRIGSTEDRLERGLKRAGIVFDQMGQRLTVVERRIKAGPLTEEQAREIKRRVNKISFLLTEQKPGEKHFQGIYAALEDEAGVTSYKSIPPAAFEAAVEWLDNWIIALRRGAGKAEEPEDKSD
jgi:hypothetical protein